MQPETAIIAIDEIPSGMEYPPEYEVGIKMKMLSLYIGVVKLVQPSKAAFPMLVTLLGMVTEVKAVQPEKAELPMLVTLSGIITDVKPLQPEKALPAMDSMPSGMVYAPEYEVGR